MYFTVFGRPIYFYAIIIAFGFILAGLYIMRRRREFGLSQDNVLDLFIIAVPAGIVGARLYYVLFNPTDYFGAGKWLNIFKTWNGGLAIYGGVIATVLGLYIYCRIKKIPVGAFLDVGGLGLLIGQTIGRWGNFINREAFGSETTLPWKMGLTKAGETLYVHPTFLYESVWNVIGFILIHRFSKRKRQYDGQIFLLYLAWYGFGRFLIEGLRTDSLYLLSTDIRISQLVGVLAFGISVFFLLRNKLRKKYSPDDLFVNRLTPSSSENDSNDSSDASDEKEIKESNEKDIGKPDTFESKTNDHSNN